MFSEVLNSDDVRHLILNADFIKTHNKCVRCNGTAYTNWNGETSDDEKPGALSEYSEIRTDGQCEDCKGIGFINIFEINE